MALIKIGDEVHVSTTVYLPVSMHQKARNAGINLSALVREVLTEELKARGIDMQPTPKSPSTHPSSSTERHASTHFDTEGC